MQLFISWSEELSMQIALVLRDWIPLVIQQVEPWMSVEEIKSGTRKGIEIARSLDETDFGIICVTHSNQHKPWLMFEAGAIAKRLDLARVVRHWTYALKSQFDLLRWFLFDRSTFGSDKQMLESFARRASIMRTHRRQILDRLDHVGLVLPVRTHETGHSCIERSSCCSPTAPFPPPR
jgi:hypothetical protein